MLQSTLTLVLTVDGVEPNQIAQLGIMTTLKIQELSRNTSAGQFTYAIYKNKVARRPHRRGRPHYEFVGSINITAADKVVNKEISVDSQLGQFLLSAIKEEK